MTRATHTHIDRRTALLGALAAPAVLAAPALAAPAEPTGALSPHLAALKVRYDEARALADELQRLPAEEYEDVWSAAWSDEMTIALEIMAQPVFSAADLGFKCDVLIRSLGGSEHKDDDMTDATGWLDRAPFRIINDARSLAGQAA